MKTGEHVLILGGAGAGDRGVVTAVHEGYVVVWLSSGKGVRVLDHNCKVKG